MMLLSTVNAYLFSALFELLISSILYLLLLLLRPPTRILLFSVIGYYMYTKKRGIVLATYLTILAFELATTFR